MNTLSKSDIEATCVRLNAKVADTAAIAPCVETHLLSRQSHEVVVAIEAAGVNPSDVKAATGLMPYAIFPRTPGRDFSGRVVEGPDALIGKAVFGSSGDLGIHRDGTHASHVVVEATGVVKIPDGMSMVEAAGIEVPFVTAIEGFRRSGMPKPGEQVLIMGVNGKVGQAAVQIATWQGAKVIGVARKDEPYEGHSNAPIAMINSATTNVAERVRELTGGHGADIVFNTVGDPYFDDANHAQGRTTDPDRHYQQDRAIQYPAILSRAAHLSRRGHPRLLDGGKRETAAHVVAGVYRQFSAPLPDHGLLDLSACRSQERLCSRDRIIAQPHRAPAGRLNMHVVRFSEAPAYTAPGHHEMVMVRLQGREAGPSSDLWAGVSVITPGGGTTLSASAPEKIYVVLDGTLNISNGEHEVAIGRWDSCRIAGGEERRLFNRTPRQ
jgi:threonine dehydrogenase-like Zn-dependent dehydrogenase